MSAEQNDLNNGAEVSANKILDAQLDKAKQLAVSEESRRLVDAFGAAEQRVIAKDTNASVFSAISARDALLAHIAKLEKDTGKTE